MTGPAPASRAGAARRIGTTRIRVLVIAMVLSAAPILAVLTRPDLVGGTLPAVAGATGLLGALVIWWQVLLGIRHVSSLVLPDRAAAVELHAWLGSAGAFLVFVHPLLEMAAERRGPGYLLAVDLVFAEGRALTIGRLALLVFLLVWLTSTLVRAAIRHRAWRRIHYLSYPLGVLVFLHANGVGTFLLSSPWLRAYWYALAAGFAAICTYRVVVPLLAPRYRVVTGRPEGGSATRYTLVPLGKCLLPEPGQFVALRTGPFSTAHPFSPVEVADDGTMALVVDRVGPFTRALEARTGGVLRLDGPHGTFTGELADDDGDAMMLAGGVGITAFARRAERHARSTVFHVSRQEHVLGDDLAAALGPRYHPVTRNGPTPFHVRQAVARGGTGARYYVCGSPRFVDGVLRDLRDEGVPGNRIHRERFDA